MQIFYLYYCENIFICSCISNGRCFVSRVTSLRVVSKVSLGEYSVLFCSLLMPLHEVK